MEALRLLIVKDYKPKHTLRVVFFMNEENGDKGGKTCATWTEERGEKQIAALESDAVGFTPRGFHCDGDEKHMSLMKSFIDLLLPYGLYDLTKEVAGWISVH